MTTAVPSAEVDVKDVRQPEHNVSSLFLNRWSPRALTGEVIPDEVLFSLFEAARWAPSSYNSQPWRFVYAKRDTPGWAPLFASLVDRNQAWAHRASALIVIASNPNFTPPGQTDASPSRSASFDTGAAWASLALQANLLGWSTRALGGFDQEAARAAVNAPDDYRIEAIIAVGKRTDVSVLPEAFQLIELPNQRRALSQSVFEGSFKG